MRHPVTFSKTPASYPLAPPELDEQGDEIRAWLATPSGRGGMRRMTQEYPTSLGTSDADTITLLGQDLAEDLMGKVGFGELTLWMVTQRRPTPSQVRVFESVLVALADHGFTPTAIAARLTYLSAPDSLQGAIAAGLLGGGSRFLGVTEDCGQYLAAVLAEAGEIPADDAGVRRARARARSRRRGRAEVRPRPRPPGAQGPRPAHPAADRDRRRKRALRGPHLRLFEAIGRVHPQVLGRTLPLNGAGVCGAVLADLGLPLAMLRGFALLARTGGLLGQLAEEQRDADRERHLHARGPQRQVRGTEV